MISVADVLASEDPLGLDPEFDGSCPCATIQGEEFLIQAHCWRVHPACEYSGIHVTGEIGHDVKVLLGNHVKDHNGWTDHTDWEVRFDSYR